MPKLALVSMVRNEIDILPTFLRHAAAVFDYAVFIDHCSVDGTAEALAFTAGLNTDWHLWRAHEPGYFQEAFCGFAMRWLFRQTDCDAVLFLDADEFVETASRQTLQAFVWAACEQNFVGALQQVHCLPLRPDAAIYHGCEHWRMNSRNGTKLVIPRSVYDRHPAVRPNLGNHVAMNGQAAITPQVIGRVLHFPLRSLAQMKQKMVCGCLGLLAREDPIPEVRRNWFTVLRRLATEELDTLDLRGMAASYGEPNSAYMRLPMDELPAAGFSKSFLTVPHVDMTIPNIAAPVDPWQIMAAAMINWHPTGGKIKAARDVRVCLNDDVLTVQHGN